MSRKQASQASFKAPLPHQVRVWLCCAALGIFSLQTFGQARALDSIPHVGQTLLAVSEAALVAPVTTASGAVLSVERRGDLIRFSATHEEVISRSQWYQTTRRIPPVVFGTADRKFHELDNRILVKLVHPERLETIAEELSAVRAKHYPGLGYSVLWLRRDQDPIGTVELLRSDQRIQKAEVQLKRPLMFPL
ncbi:MAG: hypothetical protein OXG25_11945 [Gammaproteobacteria bacterium]|nr:hypothetical protein [Gammaproteobacteria bacterium]